MLVAKQLVSGQGVFVFLGFIFVELLSGFPVGNVCLCVALAFHVHLVVLP